MSILASTIIGYARTILQDNGSTKRWSDAELLAWLNMGQDQIVALKPDVSSVITPFKLTAGKTKQNLPDGSNSYKDPLGVAQKKGIQLLDITRNMGTDGDTPGKSISIIDRVLLDQVSPKWHYFERANIIEHFVYSEKYPLIFYVCPGAHSSIQTWVELVYVAKPDTMAATSDSIDIPDEYESILLDYILFRAYSKSSDSAVHMNKAGLYYEAFVTALGSKVKTEFALDPNNLLSTPSVSVRRT